MNIRHTRSPKNTQVMKFSLNNLVTCFFARIRRVVDVTTKFPQLKFCFAAAMYLAYIVIKEVIDVTY